MVITLLSVFTTFTGCSFFGSSEEDKKLENDIALAKMLYEYASENQQLLEEVGEDIYFYMYEAMYYDRYNGNVDYAFDCAVSNNERNLEKIKTNSIGIALKHKNLQDSKFKKEVNEVKSAYDDLYDLVMKSQVHFDDYYSELDLRGKALIRALNNLALAIFEE